jgi:hypothetical protein
MLSPNERVFEGIDNQVARLEADVEMLHMKIRALKEKRNAYTLLCRLPVELLRLILQFAVDAKYAFLDDPLPVLLASPHHPKFNVSHIFNLCTRTRAVALSTPYLWSYITSANASWNDVCLDRNSQPISFIWDRVGRDPPQALIDGLMGRAREVYITRTSYAPHPAFLHTPLPYLKSLTHLPKHDYTTLDRTFLGGFTSSLTRLVLGRVFLTAGLAFPLLIQLEIERTVTHESTLCLLSLIRSSPLLQSLCLHDPAVQRSRHLPTEMSIDLPSLRTLYVGGGLLATRYLLSFLPLPSQELEIVTEIPDSPNDGQQLFDHVLRDLKASSSDIVMRVMRVQSQSQSQAFSHYELNVVYSPQSGPKRTFVVLSKTMDALCYGISSATTLHLSESSALMFFVCAAVRDLQYLPVLQHITVSLRHLLHASVLTWLQARVDLDSRLRVLDVLDDEIDPEARDDLFDTLSAGIMQDALVVTLCRNGVPIWADNRRRSRRVAKRKAGRR